VRCGLPTADACPRCAAPTPLASAACPACEVPLVHCETCGRNYPVDRTRCENVDWNCAGAPLTSARGTYAGLYGTLARTSSVKAAPARMEAASGPIWTFADPGEPALDVLSAYGRVYVFTPQSVLSLPLAASGALDALSPGVGRSEPLAARGREFRRILDVTVGFGQVCLVAETHDRRARAFVFRADDVGSWWPLEIEGEALLAVPVPHAALVFTGDRRVHRCALGSTMPDRSADLPQEPHLDAPPAVHGDGAFVVYGTGDRIVRIHVASLESAVLLGADASGPPVIGPRHVHVLTREAGAAVTVLHQIEVDSGAADAVSLPMKCDLRLRGDGPVRLVRDASQYRAIRLEPWPARLQAEAMPRPANEDVVADLVLDPALDLLLATREAARADLRVVRFDGEAVLRGAASPRFAACDDRLLTWNEGRLECFTFA
jgi:hypothetical protein